MLRILFAVLATTTLFSLPLPHLEVGGAALYWRPYNGEDIRNWGYTLDARANGLSGSYTHFQERYNTATLTIGRTICGHIDAFAGARWIRMSDKPDRFEGAGPEVGIGAESFSLFGASLRGRFCVATPVGRKQPAGETQCLPFFSFEIAARYSAPLPLIDLIAEVGYRLDYLIDFRTNDADLGFGGLFFGARVGF